MLRSTAPPLRTGLSYGLSLMLIVTILTGCGEGDFRPLASGQEGEIWIVMDSTYWDGPIGNALQSTLGKYMGTLPAPERQFDLRVVGLEDDRTLDRIRRQKNVVFVAPLSDTTNEAKYIKNVFDAQAQEAIRTGQGAVVSRPDLWRREQQIFYVTGADPQEVARSIWRRADEMEDAFADVTRTRLEREMFERGRQPDIEERILGTHGFAVNAQHDYVVALDTTNFVWMRRILTDTWRSLFVYYEEDADPSDLTPEWIYETRDSLTERYILGNVAGWVEIDRRRPLETEQIDFLGRYGFESRGLWHVIDEPPGSDQKLSMGMGGPFVTFAFYDEPTGRLYLIDGMVFAPGYSKREFLRQMEVIAHTFRTRQEAATATSGATD